LIGESPEITVAINTETGLPVLLRQSGRGSSTQKIQRSADKGEAE
jgi:hypothetical protein